MESNQKDTDSQSEEDSSESYFDIGLGLVGSLWEGAKEGWTRADALPNALAVYNEGADMSEDDYAELAKNTRAQETVAPDKDYLKFKANFDQIAEKEGYWYAFAKAAATPEGVKQLAKAQASSTVLQFRTVLPEFLGGVDLDAEDTAVMAGTTAAGAGVGYGINKLGDKILTSGKGCLLYTSDAADE